MDLRNRLALLLAMAWMTTIFFLSSQTRLPVPHMLGYQDKLEHATAYGLLAACLLLAQTRKTSGYSRFQISISVLIASLYGISDEFHQSFVPGRTPDPLDWLADTGGALLVTLCIDWFSRRRAARMERAPAET
jgi:VanZ family protein